MSIIKKFPIYLIRVGMGYATISTPDSSEDSPKYAVLLFSEENYAEDFLTSAELENAEVRYVRDERELARVLVPQPKPVTSVVLDAKFESDGQHLSMTCISIQDMLTKHLLKARCPWDYPVYFLEMPDGNFAGIRAVVPTEKPKPENLSDSHTHSEIKNEAPKTEHTSSCETPNHTSLEVKMETHAGTKMENIVALFTSHQKAKEYRQRMKKASGIQIFAVHTPISLCEILQEMNGKVYAVALDPTIDENGIHKTPQCLTTEKFLATFLLY
ncbi:MAG: hypothetical protein Q4C96_05065 [Planctomycetia bacterium]|nr:hypothetical protein [Planctomycetia bacterium]